MNRCCGLLVLTLLASGMVMAQGRLPEQEAQTLDGKRAEPAALLAKDGPTLFALAMGISQDNGMEQLIALQDTHKALAGVLPAGSLPPVLHLNLISGAPFFVHGLIRNGIAKEYSAPVEKERVLVAFVRKADSFAQALGIGLDQYGTWLLLDPSGRVLWFVKDTGPDTAGILGRRLAE